MMKDLLRVIFFMKIMLLILFVCLNILISKVEGGVEIKLVYSNTHTIFVHL